MFTNIAQIGGLGGSVPGILASQCGLPLLPRGIVFASGLEGQDSFFGGARCLTDYLADAGYYSAFVVGARLTFGGMNDFFEDHGINRLTGFDDLAAKLGGDTSLSHSMDWGFTDELVFDEAWAQFQEYSAKPNPFALIVETIGPHGPEGYLSQSCVEDGESLISPTIEPAIICTGELADEFIQKIRA